MAEQQEEQEEPAHGRVVERRCDVLIVGGGPAGLAAALQLGRQHRSVVVVDAGEPRNAPSAHVHGYLGLDGSPPLEIAAKARADVRSYGGEVLDGRVVDVLAGADGEFRAELTGGHAVVARKVLLATGLVDVLPDIDGVASQWGRGVIHCPFCHGYEFRDERLVLIVTNHMGLHPAKLFAHLTAQLTVVVHEPGVVDAAELEVLRGAGVSVVESQVQRVVENDNGQVAGLELSDGSVLDADAVVVGPRFRVCDDGFASLGVATVPHFSGLGEAVGVDEMGATSVAGVYAAGNVAEPTQQVLDAAANGSLVGAMIALALAEEDLRAPTRTSFKEADWDRRYCGDRIWSGNPNGTLVVELESTPPGRALDVGAGEGGDALWLAERGWQVTATDVSSRALEGIEAEAEHRSLAVDTHHADANETGAFDDLGPFDLVTAFYASIPCTPEDRALRNVLQAVATGGTLLVVGHDLEPMRAPIDTRTQSRMFDAGAFVGVDDFARAVDAGPDWTIDVHEKRPRPAGAASASHHVDDIVLRARRTG